MDSQLDLSDIPITIEAHVRCFALTLEKLLDLRPGSVIKARRAAGDSIDLKAGGQILCQGEIIVIDNRLAIRLSDLDERS